MAEKIIINGARMTILIHIMNAIWTFDISVVILVTKLDAENLSILENEKDSNFLYKSILKLVANPTEALLPNTPPKIPHVNETIAMEISVMIKANKLTFKLKPKLTFVYG